MWAVKYVFFLRMGVLGGGPRGNLDGCKEKSRISCNKCN